METLNNIILNYLSNSKQIIEVQRLTKHYLCEKLKLSLSDEEINILTNKENLCNYMLQNNLLIIKETPHNWTNNFCKHCGKETKFINIQKGYKKYCCASCAVKDTLNWEKSRETMIKKYGSLENVNKHIKEKSEQTCLEKYGSKRAQESIIVKQKISKGIRNFYDNVNKEEYYNGIKERKIKRHGSLENAKRKKVEKIQKTMLDKYGVLWNSQIPMVKEIMVKNASLTKIKKMFLSVEEIKNDYTYYVKLVKHITKHQNLSILENHEKRGKYKNHDKQNVYHLDHNFSIFEGFINNIPPYIIGNICNLSFIPALENIRKNKSSSISKEELFNKFFN